MGKVENELSENFGEWPLIFVFDTGRQTCDKEDNSNSLIQTVKLVLVLFNS